MYLTVDDIRNHIWLFKKGLVNPFPSNVSGQLTFAEKPGVLGWCRKSAQDTLQMFKENPKIDPKTTPYYKTSVWMVGRKKWWHGAKTPADCVTRTVYFARTLYSDVMKNGIKNAVTVIIRGDGKIILQDGYHRLFIADFIDYKKAIPVTLRSVGPNFKAMEVLLLKLGEGKRFTYHPINYAGSALYHPYFRGWDSWRKDTPSRYRAIVPKLEGIQSILDIGACEGYVSINLAAAGKDVTAIELNADRANVLKFFAALRGVNVQVVSEDWQTYCARDEKEYDAAIFLSVFHHQLVNQGMAAFKKIGLIKAKKLFFEMACNKEQKVATKFPNLTNNEIIKQVLANTKYTHWEKVYTGQRAFALRDIFMFT